MMVVSISTSTPETIVSLIFFDHLYCNSSIIDYNQSFLRPTSHPAWEDSRDKHRRRASMLSSRSLVPVATCNLSLR